MPVKKFGNRSKEGFRNSDDKPGVAAGDRARERLKRAAREYEDLFETLKELRWDERSSQNIHINVSTPGDTPPHKHVEVVSAENDTKPPPVPIRIILSWFPKKWRPVVLIILILAAGDILIEIPVIRTWLGLPTANDVEEKSERDASTHSRDIEPEPEPAIRHPASRNDAN